MAKNIDPQLKKIGNYLKLEGKDGYFVIPEYQRGYSWTITQCDKLWQDIENFIHSTGEDPYFFGTIIIDYSNEKEPNLIDGQQRTTSFILLLKALLIKISDSIEKISNNDEDSESLKDGLKDRRNTILSILYKVDAEDRAEILKKPEKMMNAKIIENRSINETYKDEILKIVRAKDYNDAECAVHKIPRKQKDNKYTNQFRNFKFFYDNLNKMDSVNINKFAKTFLEKCEIIEIRSWQIEQAITMFNSLNSTGLPLSDADIISAQLYSKSEDKEQFNEVWQKIIQVSKKLEEEKIIDINQVLSQYMYILRAKIKEYKDGDVTTPGLRRYFTVLKKHLLDNPNDFSDNVQKILDIWEKIKDFQFVKLAIKFNENIKFFLSAYCYRFNTDEIEETKVKEICECLIRLFAVLELVDAGYSSKNFKTFLFNENKKLVDSNITIKELVNDFNNHINQVWIQKDIESEIKEYNKNILVYLNEYLFCKENNRKFNINGSIHVEHIMPASGKNISSIRNDAKLDKEEFDEIVNSLGNKILLEEDINRNISNKWFRTKKQTSVKEKTGYKDSKFALAQSLTNYSKDLWEKEDIEKATGKVAHRIVEFIFN
ncbi:MAG: DUF262 domain-containing HNH endonuclease family protein [Fibromonadaceae bacterium]|jgi:uncharacterized protein with ParB-like and HNH nuclease domain|nr:DUF262 domain-containing HNH endonuclease family protein [Fibromonadaceae bacterium]